VEFWQAGAFRLMTGCATGAWWGGRRGGGGWAVDRLSPWRCAPGSRRRLRCPFGPFTGRG
jgi:hypothetical protein